MRVLLHPGDTMAVGHQRLIWPGEAAKKAGLTVDHTQGLPILRGADRSGRPTMQPAAINADVLVFQRPSNPEIVDMLPKLQARGHTVVVDVDDDIASVPTTNAVYGKENHRLILKACATADLVTVSTPALAARYAPHGRVVVLRNCIPDALLDMPFEGHPPTVGWGGWVGSHPGDLEATYGGVAEAVRRHGARFHVIGPVDGVQQRLHLDEEPTATGPLVNVAEHEYERALGALDVGIVPLCDSKFNAAKSWLKGLQYAARGVPFVASRTPEYELLHEMGAGTLVTNRGRSWRSAVTALLTNDQLWQEAELSGRDVAEDWTFSRNGHLWAEAWTKAYVRRLRLGRQAPMVTA